MIFYWLTLAFHRLVWLFRPPAPRDVARIHSNGPCPVCGARVGTVRAVAITTNSAVPSFKVLCEHTCGHCGCRSFEEPIVKIAAGTVWPAVPRNDLERRADADRTFRPGAGAN